ncbi:hypothetical protein BC833DRAFT_579044 [Globomyces pollinis-pini]|nr:hypothetical protein BC833DRAFT_579044 [Globomyces pollinis-pini]
MIHKLLWILTIIGIVKAQIEKGSCPQCPSLAIGKLPYCDIHYADGRIDCFCGEEGKKVIDCNGKIPNPNFPYQGYDCRQSILNDETNWTTCINSQPRTLLSNAGNLLFSCAVSVGAIKTLADGTRPGAPKPTATSEANSNPLPISTVIISVLAVLVIGILAAILFLYVNQQKQKSNSNSNHSQPTIVVNPSQFYPNSIEMESQPTGKQHLLSVNPDFKPSGTNSDFYSRQQTAYTNTTMNTNTNTNVSDESWFLDSRQQTTSTESTIISDKIYFFTDGGNPETFVQHLHHTLFPPLATCQCVEPHIAYSDQELNVLVNDSILIEKHLDDGWVQCEHLGTHLKGKIPMTCITPKIQSEIHYILFEKSHIPPMVQSIANNIPTVKLHTLELQRMMDDEALLYPILGTLAGHELFLINGNDEFVETMKSFLTKFGSGFWKTLQIVTI